MPSDAKLGAITQPKPGTGTPSGPRNGDRPTVFSITLLTFLVLEVFRDAREAPDAVVGIIDFVRHIPDQITLTKGVGFIQFATAIFLVFKVVHGAKFAKEQAASAWTLVAYGWVGGFIYTYFGPTLAQLAQLEWDSANFA